MKKINLLIIAFISLFIFTGNVFADASIECTGGGVTCKFTSKGGSLNGTCKNGSGVSYSAMNLNGHLDSKQNLSDMINNYSYQDVSSCPGIMIVDDSSKNVIFAKGDGNYFVSCPYATEVLGKTGLTCDSYEPNLPLVSSTIGQTVDYINLVGSQLGIGTNFKSYSVTTVSSEVGEDCDSQLQLLYDKVVDKQTDVKNANCAYNSNKSNCESLLSAWKNEIENAKKSSSELLNKGVCTKSQVDTFNKRISEEIEDYSNIVTTEKTTGTNPYYTNSGNVGDNFCSEPSVKQVLKFFGILILILKIAVPLIIIVKGMFLFYNAVIKGESSDLQKNAKEFGMKVFLGLLVFLIPGLVDGIWDLFDSFDSVESDYTNCEQCLLDPENCS
ncbi:MAG: hypothetical protein IJS56_00540 [Bacilli bacterium]|nr:hypothetical protein [Bacilli bacterium]